MSTIPNTAPQPAPLTTLTDEQSLNWMCLVNRHIACPEIGYPISEARWASIEEYVEYLENK